MARLLSPVASIMRGSVAGLTYFSNQFHQIVVRARTAPVQPSTPYQSTIRQSFDRGCVEWDNLTDSDRALWNDYAATCKFPGPLGEYTVPGRQLMIGCYAFLQYILTRSLASPSIDTHAPSVNGFAGIDTIIASALPAPGTGFQVSVHNPNSESLCVMIERSLGFKPSRTRYKGPWVCSASQALLIPTDTSSAVSFTGLSVGMRYFYRVRGVTEDDPMRESAAFIGNVLATTTV